MNGAGLDSTTPSVNGVAQDDLVIPVIDFSNFLHGDQSQKSATAAAILHAFRTSGFLYLSHHGIPSETVSTIFALSASFFARPQAQKDALAWLTPESNRGYVTLGREKVSLPDQDVNVLRANPDLKETMEIGREGVDGMPNQFPDRFDKEGVEFTKTMKAFFLTCKDLHVKVMRAIAVGMGYSEDFFDSYTDVGDNNLRLLHYPSVLKSVFKNNRAQVRAGEHSDYGSVTLLFQDDVGGLEVRSPKGTFVRAKPIPGTVVVNAGDLLTRWSNDTIQSTRHRVVQPPDPEDEATKEDPNAMYKERYSVAYFCNPNFDRVIDVLPGTGSKKYESIKSGDYLVQRLSATY
ncbi:MAG: hypothetical protein Q9227_008799 [Pyrenula ochraceoflavens]